MNRRYKPPHKPDWTGRFTPIEGEYWYQQIQLVHIQELADQRIDVGLVGYACDEGVRRNQGRAGAREGPGAIRNRLGKLAFHHQRAIADFGDVVCDDNDMEGAQEALSNLTERLLMKKVFPIVLGGGHDVAYGHFNGIKRVFSTKKIGVINFDAHFDLRPVVDQSSSGTPFYQILSENEAVDYMVIGVQHSSNTRSLFDFAKEQNAGFWTIEKCLWMTGDKIEAGLQHFIQKNDIIYVSIDLDGFSSAFAPGVSAPSPVGLEPKFVWRALKVIFESRKAISLDIAELNPLLDPDQKTAMLAARLIDFVTGL